MYAVLVGFTIFLHEHSPGVVASLLESKGCSLLGEPDKWNIISPSLEDGSKIIFTYDNKAYEKERWAQQLAGLENIVSGFEIEPERLSKIVSLVRSFKYQIGVVFEPEHQASGDQRLSQVAYVASAVNGVIFDNNSCSLMNAEFKYFATPAGDSITADVPSLSKGEFEDPQFDEFKNKKTFQTGTTPPDASRVAKRLYCLSLVSGRALVDVNHSRGFESAWSQPALLEQVDLLDLGDEIEEEELRILQTPEKGLEHQQLANGVWSIESAVVLAWALGVYGKQPFDQLVDVDGFMSSIGFLDQGASRSILLSSSLRNPQEIQELRSHVFSYHWRMTSLRVNAQPLVVGESYPFDKKDFDWAHIVDGDVSFDGIPVSQLPPQKISELVSLSLERHKAVNWLNGDHELYSEIETST